MKHKYAKDIILLLVIIISSLLVCGCGNDKYNDVNDGFCLYYLNEEGTRLETADYNIKSEAVSEQVNEVLAELYKKKDDLTSPIPSGVEIISYSISNGVLNLNFGTYYSSLDSVSEIFLRASIVLTLTQIDEVDYVSFYIEDQPLKDAGGSMVGMMKASDFTDKVGNSLNNYENTTVTLYFANLKGNSLRTEIRTGVYDSSKSLERYIVEQIIDGPAGDGNYRTVPKETAIRSINTNNGICYIDFSEEFSKSASSVKDEIMVYSIVNSLTELSYICKVQISVEGDTEVILHKELSLDTPLIRDLSYMEK